MAKKAKLTQVDGAIPTGKIIQEILEERVRQDEKFGVQDHPPAIWSVIIGEEYGEVCQAILNKDSENYREELIQMAAACVAALECLDKKPV